ncbi:MSHA biogenesis protein MshP [Aeromonas sp. R4-1]|uniref:MSHA biogenesis protein MshP n=1 Tax=Aeromonas sp. R4-1 TaxID=3138464 RepID=UPI0034A564B5
MFPKMLTPKRQGGSALMIALFVIVVMALLAAALGRLLTDSSEKNTVEVRSVRALLAAQSGLEIALYQLFPNRPAAPPADRCSVVQAPPQFSNPGLVGCQVAVSCQEVPVTYNTQKSTGYRLQSVGTCSTTGTTGTTDLNSANPDFAVSRSMMVEAFEEGSP